MSGSGARERLPITSTMLRKLKGCGLCPFMILIQSSYAQPAVCLFAFLRAGEMTTPDEGYNPAVHLSYAGVALDDP